MFLIPSILFGSALAAIPILVHLMNRQKTTPISWGAMQFLLETPLKVKRRQRIDHWLLMLVRMLILAVIALLLARPTRQGTHFASDNPVDVAVVIDHSLSMGHRTSAPDSPELQTLFSQAISSTERLAAILPDSASLSIVLAEHAPKTVTASPLQLNSNNRNSDKSPRGDFANTLAQLRQLKPGMTDADIPQAIQAAIEMASRGRNQQKMIVVITDNQRSNWLVNNETAWRTALGDRPDPKNFPVYALALSENPTTQGGPNVAVRPLVVQPDFVGVGRPAQILAPISNTGHADLAGAPIQLIVDGKTVQNTQLPPLAAGQMTTLRFDYTFPTEGSHWVRVQSDLPDALDADNAATTSVTVRPRLNVLIVDGKLSPAASYPAAAFLETAIHPEPAAFIQSRTISIADLASASLSDYPVVILNDVPRLSLDLIDKLTAYTQAGNGLWIILGPRTEPAFLQTLAKSQLFPATASAPVTLNAPGARINVKEPQDPTVQLITANQRNAFATTSVLTWWRTTPNPEAKVVLAAVTPSGSPGNGDPLTMETDIGKNGGRAIVWTTPLNGTWNFLHLAAYNMVPLVQETLFHLAAARDRTQLHTLNAGETLAWSGPATPHVDFATLLDPQGNSHQIPPQLRGDKQILAWGDTFVPGLYELRFSHPDMPQPVFYSINIDQHELDPSTLTSADIEWLKTNQFLNDRIAEAAIPNVLGARTAGLELWWLLGILVLALLIFETLLTRRLVKQQVELDPEHAGMIDPALADPLTARPQKTAAAGVGG